MDSKRVTLQVIADKAHVSRALVSRVLNNREVRVSAQKRAQILKIASDLNYISRVPPDLSPARHEKLIALIHASLDFDFMVKLATAATSKAAENGYTLVIFDSQEKSAEERIALKTALRLGVSGIILSSCNGNENRDFLDVLHERAIPLVFIDRYIHDDRFSLVGSENQKSMELLTEKMIERGHRDIVNIVQDKSTLTNVSMNRIRGFYNAMDKYGLSGYNEIIYPDRDSQWQPVYSLLTSAQKFSAFILNTSWDMKYFSDMIRTLNYAQYGKFEVGVFDDFMVNYSEIKNVLNDPAMNNVRCFVRQDPKQMAERAVDILISHIKKGPRFEPVHELIPCEIVDLE